MAVGTYGLSNSIRGPAGGGGLGLADMGQDQQQQATDMLGQAAAKETERGIYNKRARQQQKQGAVAGAASGAAVGFQVSGGNPWGALAGGVIGAVASGIFD